MPELDAVINLCAVHEYVVISVVYLDIYACGALPCKYQMGISARWGILLTFVTCDDK